MDVEMKCAAWRDAARMRQDSHGPVRDRDAPAHEPSRPPPTRRA
ncbi:hypothetical protein BURPS668_0048 [Burkholderia pseudomallei 668]|uniref:Uncharacterized protein n=1 Tax=Burkholderia pseudomallei 1710a TaxID=320371 RepID=A0A0E1WIW5_BURPE|nr:hypothetical protein BURPS668_0048 [Burkholderia pseudomallei 668]EET09572.1 hypothetical protein BURPS1710A_0306 [Burkholderia pseudomallei 1710a]